MSYVLEKLLDLGKLCDYYIAGCNTYILYYLGIQLFGFIHIRKCNCIFKKLNNDFTIIRLKENNQKDICKKLHDKKLVSYRFKEFTLCVLV